MIPDNCCIVCGATLVIDVDHWCRCVECDTPIPPDNDYDELCKACSDIVWQDEQRAGYFEQNWHNDHGDFE